jgi:Flp pilus assembly protein TadG
MKPLPRRNNGQRGVAALEFALVAMLVLIPMVLGIWQIATAISEYNTIAKSVRDATRYLTLQLPGTRTAAGRCLVLYGNVQVAPNGNATCVGDLLLPNLASATVTICEATSCPATHANVPVAGAGPINLVTVTVTDYTYRSWVPSFIADITFGRGISNTMRAPS